MERAVTIESNKTQANPDNWKKDMSGEEMENMLSRWTIYQCEQGRPDARALKYLDGHFS